MTQRLLARHPEQGAMAYAHWAAGKDQQPDQGDQAHGLRLPEQRILFHENQERLTRQSVRNLFCFGAEMRATLLPSKLFRNIPP